MGRSQLQKRWSTLLVFYAISLVECALGLFVFGTPTAARLLTPVLIFQEEKSRLRNTVKYGLKTENLTLFIARAICYLPNVFTILAMTSIGILLKDVECNGGNL